MRTCVRWAFIISSIFGLAGDARAGSFDNAGTVEGSGAGQNRTAVQNAPVRTIHDAMAGFIS